MNKIVIWGTGTITGQYLKDKTFKQSEIICFIDNSEEKQGTKLIDREILSFNDFIKLNLDYDYLIVLTIYSTSIFDQCKKSGNIDFHKVIFLDNACKDGTGKLLNSQQPDIRNYYPNLQKDIIKRIEKGKRYLVSLSCSYDIDDSRKLIGNEGFSDELYMRDYFRFRTFELLGNELLKEELSGAAAEIGVFKGTFAALINAKFSHKKLYLFDTFEGFDKDEFKKEVRLGRCDKDFYKLYEQNSVTSVLSKMPYQENCIVRKGLFPNTTKGLENERFFFVSIDVDLEESIYQSLCYFYPRLVDRGYLFIHDYNCNILQGVRSAITRYEKENKISLRKVPIADGDGSLIVCK